MSGNIKHKITGLLQAVLAAGLIAFATGAAAEDDNASLTYNETVRVTIDFAKIVTLDEPASTVIVGNSGIVEAAIDQVDRLAAQRVGPGSQTLL